MTTDTRAPAADSCARCWACRGWRDHRGRVLRCYCADLRRADALGISVSELADLDAAAAC